MAALSDADRNALRTKAYLVAELGLDPLLIAVEAIVQRHVEAAVNEALTEASRAITSGLGSRRALENSSYTDGLVAADHVVRARRTPH